MAQNKKKEARKKERRLIQTNVRLSKPHRNWLTGRARKMSADSGVHVRRPDVVRKLIDDEMAREGAEKIAEGLDRLTKIVESYGEQNAEVAK